MLEHATYSAISPQGCASILWKDAAKAPAAAEQLKITAADLLRFEIIDAIVEEPTGGAHRDFEGAAQRLGDAIAAQLEALAALTPAQLREDRYRKFRAIGAFSGDGALG
jgi:acetyl-CoA carboxylase alpha subunit